MKRKNNLFKVLFGFIYTFAFVSCGSTNSQTSSSNQSSSFDKKSIVVYFSATETTRGVVEKIQNVTNSSIYRIEAKVPYTSEDLNYNNNSSRANQEQNDPSARPEIGSSQIEISDYDIIFLGYPIWWGQAPKIMYTFVESYDLSGKVIAPFCTSGSSVVGSSATNLATSASNATWKDGKRFNSSCSLQDISNWIADLNL